MFPVKLLYKYIPFNSSAFLGNTGLTNQKSVEYQTSRNEKKLSLSEISSSSNLKNDSQMY